MLNNGIINSKDTFENPFEDINANVLDPKKIVEYWCSPFAQGLLSNFDEHKFRTSKIPIILQGSRGSGKTTILKYFSYPSQIERAEENKTTFLNTIAYEKEVGFYYRCDDSFISTFKSIFMNVDHERWTIYFDHYLEMIFCKSILEMLFVLIKRKEVDLGDEKEFILELIKAKSLEKYDIELSLNGVYGFICDQVNYINNFKNQFIFTNEKFAPQIIVSLFDFSEKIISLLKEYIPEFKEVLFVMMFDEFENLSTDLQKRFNTLIKFAKENISIRIGRRSEGIITSETINQTEYLRENHDYYLASLEKELDKNNKNVREYFLEIAKKRFSVINGDHTQALDIVHMLGDKENYDVECMEACKSRKLHLTYILKEIPELSEDENMRERIIEIIKNDENPIAETLNALWVLREKKNYYDAAKNVANIMRSYFAKDGQEDTKKYANDYTNKYRYAITVFICSVYKRSKLYYGFNAICYLSNGNTRTFINLCRTIISDALFYEKKKFIDTGMVSKEVQSRAIHNYSQAEFDEICSIIKYGNYIRNFVMNIGNIFSTFHKDRKMRYPETNQFVFSEVDLYPQDREIIEVAKSWAMIIKKEKAQRVTASIDKKADIYHINKIFYPIFNISYRTRGGVNPTFSREEIHGMLTSMNYSPISLDNELKQENKHQKTRKNGRDDGQLSLFDIGGVWNDE